MELTYSQFDHNNSLSDSRKKCKHRGVVAKHLSFYKMHLELNEVEKQETKSKAYQTSSKFTFRFLVLVLP